MSIAGNTLDLIRSVFRREASIAGGPSYMDGTAPTAGNYGVGAAMGPQGGYNQFITDSVKLNQDLLSRYADYEDMDEYPELGSALDLFSDDATQQDVITGKSIWVEAEDETVGGILNEMLHKQLRIEEDIWEITRSMNKYGNNFEEIIVMDQVGVVKLNHVLAPTMRRIEDNNGILYGYMSDAAMQFKVDTAKFMEMLAAGNKLDDQTVTAGMRVYEPWEVVHFRLRGKSRKDLYGSSVLDSARWVWKRLAMLEDAMVLYKLTRSPQRYAFYVDVGDVPPNQALAQVNKVKNEFKKQKFVDPSTGKLSFRFNPLSMDEDLFIPVRKGKKSTEIDVLSGPEGQQVEDALYFRDKLFAALKIPKSYLGADETVGRANLSQLDVRFARTVLRIQREVKNGMSQVCRVDLAARNIDPDRVAFDVKMVVPSGALEMAQMEVRNAKLDLADRYRNQNFSEYFIWSNILGMADDEILAIQTQRAREQGGENNEAKKGLERHIDMAADKINPNEVQHKDEILDEMSQANTDLGKRLKQLKGLVGDIRQAMSSTKTKRR